jgi:D-arabinan exo alpha-(1,3)/(1,5)-arabinofuranosidase (non-reducing end)
LDWPSRFDRPSGRDDHRRVRHGKLAVGLVATAGICGILWFAGRRAPEKSTRLIATPRPSPAAAPLPPPGPEPTPAPGEISVLTLLHEMADLDHLARLPTPRFAAGQAASTDRRSKRPSDAGGWFANDDFVTDTEANLVRMETAPDGGKRYVLLDVAGPGAVVRIWSANPTGTLRIHVDGDARPALEAPMAALLSGEVPPFAPPFGQITARGYSLYFPIPYRTRCVVTVDSIVSPDPFNGRPTAKLYYQVGYRSYRPEAAADVRPYATNELARAGGAIARTAALLRDGLPPPSPRPDRHTIALPTGTLDRQHPVSLTVRAPAGGGRLTELRLATSERAPDKLRSTTLTLAFDGEETVSAPLVAFFGTSPEIAPYRSLPMVIEPDGTMVCRFPMPFRNRAVLRVSRDSDGAAELHGSVTVDAAAFDGASMLFRATWRPRAVLRTRPFQDWHIATLEGTGQQVGTLLDVENPPGVAWWGEGDEKLFVDGESFPSLFGTGTEDYFGYAWSSAETFAHAYHAQTRAPAGSFAGLFSMNRFLVLDPVPFERSLRFDLEIWHWSETSIAADAILYWYARPGARDDLPRAK